MDRPWEAFDRARRVLRGRDDLVGWKSADLPSEQCVCGGVKPELVQCLAALRRADITELLRHDPKTAWLTVRRKKRTRRAHPPKPPRPSTAQPPDATLLHSSKYSAASSDGAGGTAVAETWYDTSNIFPSAEGVRASERLTEQTAVFSALSPTPPPGERARAIKLCQQRSRLGGGAAMRGP